MAWLPFQKGRKMNMRKENKRKRKHMKKGKRGREREGEILRNFYCLDNCQHSGCSVKARNIPAKDLTRNKSHLVVHSRNT